MSTVVQGAKAGGVGSVSGMSEATPANIELNINLPASAGLKQIMGLVPLLPCTPTDCRYSPQDSEFLLPVFGQGGIEGATYANDLNTFRILSPGESQFVIEQLQDKFFQPNSDAPCTWVTVATITNNTYGVYIPKGGFSEGDYPNQTQFTVNWGSVIGHFGNGIYRISVQTPTIVDEETAGTQASVEVVIENEGFPAYMQGTFSIGTVNIAVVYTGTYIGYLTYLAAKINEQGQYTAIATSNGLIISGTNFNVSNGVIVKSSMLNTSTAFNAEQEANPLLFTIPIFSSGTMFPIESGTNSPVDYTMTAVPSSTLFPRIPVVLNYNNGGSFNPATGVYTAGSDPVQNFKVIINCIADCLINGRSTYVNFTSYKCTVSLLINGSVKSQISYTFPNEIMTSLMYQFPPTNGVGANPPTLRPGDQVTITCVFEVDFTPGGGTGITVTGRILPQIVQFYNVSSGVINTTLGTLEGGAAPTTEYVGALASPPFKLWAWDCLKAQGTVKFETNFTGTIGDRMTPGNLFDNSNPVPIYDSIRLPGFFGKWSAKYEEILQEYGFNPATTFGTITTVRDKQVGKYKLNILPVPYELIRRLSVYAFMPPGMLISDYNFNNGDWFLQQYPVKKAGAIEPVHYNDSNFGLDYNWKNRLVSIKDMEFEEGIQSLIFSYTDLLS